MRTTDHGSAGSQEAVDIRTAGNSWTESGLTWNNRPATGTTILGTIGGGTVASSEYQADLLSSTIRGLLGTSATIALTQAGSDGFWFWSRNHANSSYHPTIALTFARVGTADTTPPTSPTDVTAGVSGSTVTLQ